MVLGNVTLVNVVQQLNAAYGILSPLLTTTVVNLSLGRCVIKSDGTVAFVIAQRANADAPTSIGIIKSPITTIDGS